MLTLFLSSFLPAQSITSRTNSPTDRWHLDATVNGVQFYYALESCGGKNVVFLKLNNTNSYAVQVSWKEEFTTQFEQKTEGNKGQKKLVLPAGETSETDCAHPKQKLLLVLPENVNPAYPAEVSAFRYKSITVSRLK